MTVSENWAIPRRRKDGQLIQRKGGYLVTDTLYIYIYFLDKYYIVTPPSLCGIKRVYFRVSTSFNPLLICHSGPTWHFIKKHSLGSEMTLVASAPCSRVRPLGQDLHLLRCVPGNSSHGATCATDTLFH